MAAAPRIFAILELLELILVHADTIQIFVLHRVNSKFKDVIADSEFMHASADVRRALPLHNQTSESSKEHLRSLLRVLERLSKVLSFTIDLYEVEFLKRSKDGAIHKGMSNLHIEFSCHQLPQIAQPRQLSLDRVEAPSCHKIPATNPFWGLWRSLNCKHGNYCGYGEDEHIVLGTVVRWANGCMHRMYEKGLCKKCSGHNCDDPWEHRLLTLGCDTGHGSPQKRMIKHPRLDTDGVQAEA